MRVFASYEEVNQAILAIKTLMEKTEKIPDILVNSYRESLAHATKGIVQRFYQNLAKECPEALKYF